MSVKTPAEGKCFVATYGSLRRGMHNTRVNQMAGGELVGLGNTDRPYNLYDLGSFPSISLVHTDQETPVRVEVYETNIEGGLEGPYDRLEGYPHFYNRTEVPVTLDNGDTLTAWIYHIDEDARRPVEGGDW
ncbi:UNVERIFIED_CONTAM: gamma-glutamylcyclotransferase family protein, partial [Kocuria sp. CPCC 205274]